MNSRPTQRWIAMAVAATAAAPASALSAGSDPERSIQIRSVDFEAEVLEVFNFGTTDVDLSGWRFCSHDFDEAFRYTSPAGLQGVTIEANSSIFVHFEDDAPGGDPDRFNRSALGAFAAPLDSDAFGIQFYFPNSSGNVSFGNSALIADHLQWSQSGSVGAAATRSSQAVSEGLWSGTSDFIGTAPNSSSIELLDLSGDEAGAPSEYSVLAANNAHDEAVDGDLSDDRLAPTAVSLEFGDNRVRATQQGNAFGRDIDYLTITVPLSAELTELRLVDFVAGPGNLAFLGLQSGSTFTVDASSAGAGDLLGGAVFGAGEVGVDLLPVVGGLPGAAGFTPPLGPGDYTFWLNQTGPASTAAFEFTLEDRTIGAAFCATNPNSSGSATQLTAVGSTTVTANDFALIATNVPASQPGLFFLGLDQAQVPFGDGFLCIGGSLVRINPPVFASAAGEVTRSVDLLALPVSTVVSAGATTRFQFWHRDPFVAGSGFNLSNGLTVQWD
ncbi:MAG: hypothetical protein AAFR54_08830 [Planctomycetota bacterium]